MVSGGSSRITSEPDYADFMPVAIPVIPYLGLSALLGVNGKG